MLHGHLTDPGTYAFLTAHPTWQQAFAWLHGLRSDIALGEYEILGRDMFASVQEYATLARHEARFESHEAHIDIQYTLKGVEGIDWIPRSALQPDGPFGNDVQFWLPPPEPVTTLAQSAGRFAIFFPSDAHRPKVRLPGHDRVRKLVIKIHQRLLT
ncbi:MAG: YhcH/YjgK/YiaL family protein [Verrucomicrobia bacterium]|nr:YhcH/YjgK/YiaL family protein [Verrucomicrobiota bacterium]